MGGIVLDERDPFYVHHAGSTAVCYGLRETDDMRQAARDIIDLFASEPLVVVIDHAAATVRCFPKAALDQ